MNSKRIAELRELCEKAMNAPWDNVEPWNDYQDRDNPKPLLHLRSPYGFANEADFKFIASARTALPEALDEIERLRMALKIATEALELFKLNHEHKPDLEHTRALGDSYGWCDYCHTKVSWGPGEAEIALSEMARKTLSSSNEGSQLEEE